MNRRRTLSAVIVGALFLATVTLADGDEKETRQATGVKVGEVTPTSAIVWLRVTARAMRNSEGTVRKGRPMPAPKDLKVEELEGECVGAAGQVRLRYGVKEDLTDARDTDWVEVKAERDFAHQFELSGLKPNTVYHYSAETAGPGGKPRHVPLRGRFETAPQADRPADVTFTVVTGQAYKDIDHRDGFHIYEAMGKLNPKFLVPTGDTVYYDSEDPRATTVALARYHWHRMYGFPRHIAFHLRVPGYWEKDDHDTVSDDCWPTLNPAFMLPMTFKDGQRIFREQVPMGDKTYRSCRWGKDLQVWLCEGRDFRSPNTMKDGPDKSIWGVEQKRWLMDSIKASDATWKVLVSPTPIVGPDRAKKADNHANAAFFHEGDEFRQCGTGGVYSSGTLDLIDSTVRDNTATSAPLAGGLCNTSSGTATLANTTVSGNFAVTSAGGIRNSGTLTLTNSTISGNRANSDAGGMLTGTGSVTTLTNSTVTANHADDNDNAVGDGGGIEAFGAVTLRNTIVAGNFLGSGTSTGGDIQLVLSGSVSADYSFIGVVAGGTVTGSNNLTGNAMLGALANNGGLTLTHLPQPGSPVIDAGDPDTTGLPPTDQRGGPRLNGRVDIGSLELPTQVSISATDASADENTGGDTATFTLTRTGDIANPLTVQLSQTLTGASVAEFTLAAGAGGSFDSGTLTFTFQAGNASGTLVLTPVDDVAAEAAETVQLTVVDTADYELGASTSATATIVRNDFAVTNTNDSGEGSLRQAIDNANNIVGANTIAFAGSVFTDATPDTITLTSGQLQLTETGAGNITTITGPTASALSVSGNNASRIFQRHGAADQRRGHGAARRHHLQRGCQRHDLQRQRRHRHRRRRRQRSRRQPKRRLHQFRQRCHFPEA